MTKTWANKSLQPMPVGRPSSAFAVDIFRPAWLSSGRWRKIRMENQATSQRQVSNRTAFWVVFLTLVLVCLGFLLPLRFQAQDAARTCDLLRPLIGAEPRFKRVDVHRSTNGRAIVSGTVDTAEDAAALRQVIAQTRTPQQPAFLVRVIASTNDNR